MVSNWRLGEAFVICGINVQNHSTLIRKKKSKRMIMIMVIVIYYWLTITINYRDTKYKTKKENYGCPLISLGYHIPLLIAEKVYQMTVESQSRRVLYSQRWVWWNNHQHSKCISKRFPFQIALQPWMYSSLVMSVWHRRCCHLSPRAPFESGDFGENCRDGN